MVERGAGFCSVRLTARVAAAKLPSHGKNGCEMAKQW